MSYKDAEDSARALGWQNTPPSEPGNEDPNMES
jgi:hypothetical protein